MEGVGNLNADSHSQSCDSSSKIGLFECSVFVFYERKCFTNSNFNSNLTLSKRYKTTLRHKVNHLLSYPANVKTVTVLVALRQSTRQNFLRFPRM